MKVLMIQRFDVYNVSCARRILAMAEVLAVRGHMVTLVNFPHEERRRQLPQLIDRIPDGVACVDFDRSGTSLRRNIRRATELAGDCDLVHLWKCYPDAALPALWAAYWCNKPIHYDMDDYEKGISLELTGSRLVAETVGMWEQTLPRLVDSITVSSEELKRKAIEYGFSQEGIFDAPVGADLERFFPSERDPGGLPAVVYCGQIEVADYATLAVRAFSQVAEEFPDIRLKIVGGGSGEDAVRGAVERMGLADRVQMTGYVPSAEIPGILRDATIALAPFEDTQITRCKSPLKVVEYLASGLPVVGSAVGEVPRMLENCGLVAAAGSADAMAQGIRRILADSSLREEMKRSARQKAEEVYNWERTVDSLEEAYRVAMEKRQ